MKKWLSLFLACMMTLCLAASALAEVPEYLNVDLVSEDGVWNYPMVKDKDITIRVVVSQASTQGNAEDIWYWEWIRQKLGVNIEVEQVQDRTEYKNIAFATGSLPDIMINMGVTASESVNYGAGEGMLLKIDEYIDSCMPNLKKVYDEHPDFKDAITAPDGHIYSLGNIGEEVNMSKLKRIFINQRWLEEAGLETPETLDEFIDMLRAFKARGENIIPMAGGYNATNPGMIILAAYGYVTDTASGMGIALRNGEVMFPYGDRELYGEYLRTMNTLYTEGLISHDYYTLDANTVRAAVAEDISGVYADTHYLAVPDTFSEWWAAKPLTSAFNDTPVWPSNTGHLSLGVWAISSETKYPEVCAALGDLFFNRYGAVYGLLGPMEGSEDLLGLMGGWFALETNGKYDGGYDFRDLYNDPQGIYGASAYTYRMKKVGALSGYALGITGNNMEQTVVEMAGHDFQMATEWDMTNPDAHYKAALEENMAPYCAPMYPPITFFTAEQTEQMTDLRSVINSYAESESAKFITGQRPLTDEELTKYFDGLDALGYQEYLQFYVDYYAENAE